MSARIIRFHKRIERSWFIRQVPGGLWEAILGSRTHGIEARIRPGSYQAVRDAVTFDAEHRGAPLAPRVIMLSGDQGAA